MRWDEIKDTPVMSIAEGTKLGSVHDLLLDETYLQIAALVIGGGGLLGGQRRAVAYSDVRGIGRDAVMVSGQDAVHEVRDTAALGVTHRLGELRQDVMSESGVRLGQVADVEFDPPTGAVTALRFIREGATAPDGMDASIVSRAQIVQLTAKMAVVQHAVLEHGADETDAARAPVLGQVVGQESAGAPVHEGDTRAEEQAVTARGGQQQHMQAAERVART